MNAFLKEPVSKITTDSHFPRSADSLPNLTHLSKQPTNYRAGAPVSVLRKKFRTNILWRAQTIL